jgi:hypothetical protein
VNVLPRPGSLRTWISPPISRAISRLMDSPWPVPPNLRLIVPSACWKASKIVRSCSGGMPIPVSVTSKATTWSATVNGAAVKCSSALLRIVSVTSPAEVNFTAFESRLRNTC